MVSYIAGPVYKKLPNLLGFNPVNIKPFIPDLLIWGGAALSGVALFTEGIPLFRASIFTKIPYYGSHWEYNPDPEDVPV